jgi:hypothetical protein
MSTGLEDKLTFDFDKPDFQKQYGGQTGTIREKKNGGGNTAEIIGASADGLDSVTNLISLFTGKQSQETNYTPPPPPEKKKVSPLLLVGGAAVVVLLIIFLISSKNGQATTK